MPSLNPNQKLAVLLTNDDGPESPFLAPLIEALSQEAEFAVPRVVVPSDEKSWCSQSTTRSEEVHTFSFAHPAGKGHLVNGTPTDCVCLGLDRLYLDRAQLVVSGINVGINAGLGFHYSSGTVGAARQAALHDVRSIALSAHVPSEIFELWSKRSLLELGSFESCFKRLSSVALRVVKTLSSSDAFWDGVDFYSVNLPWESSEATSWVLTPVERRLYLPLFKESKANTYVHRFSGFLPLPATDSPHSGDMTQVLEGKISISPIVLDVSPSSDRMQQLQAFINQKV